MITLKTLLPVTLFACGASLLAGGKLAPVGPRAEVPVMAFDAGKVPASQPVRHSYAIKNTGDAPLTIKDVKPG